MRFVFLFAVVALSFPSASQAFWDKGILESINGGYVRGSIKKGNVAKVSSTGVRNARPDVASKLAIYKIALLAREAGFVRFGVVKQWCGTLMMSGVELNHQCKAEAQLLRADEPDEMVKPRGNTAVSFFDAEQVIVAVESDRLRLQRY
ncbi:hypothetical protein ACFQRC_05600 [Enterovirga sp. GCM10030262]|uniref:hypothetical protein n=1 Tax=Enterovirga sp. GCM10030262 TaxID=3273391 RepID=UPI0036070A71